jgi:hypothetical protein
MCRQKSEDLRWRLGFPNAVGVSSIGLSGGLVIFWKNEVVMDLKSFSKNHIDVWITETDGKMWRFTGFYGEPARSRRSGSWHLLRFLRNQADLPWLCAGDFNEILYAEEQMGGNDREERCMDGFRDVVDYCGFSDLGYTGLPYTWDNRRAGAQNVKARLDRCLADEAWLDLFGDSTVTHIQTTESDHCAMLLHLVRSGGLRRNHKTKLFRYENMWQRHPFYNDTVAAGWRGGCTSLADANENLGHLQATLARWGQEDFGSVKGELR